MLHLQPDLIVYEFSRQKIERPDFEHFLRLYPLGHRIKESWGRAVVEAMLTGCVPVVPDGHQFHKLMVHGETRFVCRSYDEFRDCVRRLYEDYPWRIKLSRQASDHARTILCNPEQHKTVWIEALTF